MIVLLTDFGESEYVGVMKGVILNIAPDAHIVDLTHSIPPQSVREAAWVLLKSHKYFPRHTIFVCVVDPGVGTARDAVLVTTPDYVFIGPDNGLFHEVTKTTGIDHIYSIMVDSPVSSTFHGRDVFAVAAARFHSGIAAREIGTPKKALDETLSFYLEGRTGEIVRIDRFSNIVTNIPLESSDTLQVRHGETQLRLKLVETYAQGPSEGLFLVVGSYGTLEIASQNRRATDFISVKIGERITIEK
jgi:S-adenosylmethionine hydrolase